MRFSTMLLFCTCALSAAIPGQAQERALYGPPDKESWCRGGSFPHEGPRFGLARVVVDKTHFVKDWDAECPQAASCIEKAYLVRGDLVATTRRYGAWTCAAYPKGGYTEWVKTGDLVPVATETQPPSKAWTGNWVNGMGSGFNAIRLSAGAKAGTLAVDGTACWGKGCMHEGSIAATARPEGNAIAFKGDDDDCRLSLVLLGDYLVATDNNQCGGMNVSFSDVYWKPDSLGKRGK